MNGIEKYNQRVESTHSLLCVGLDADRRRLPERFQNLELPQFEFNKFIIDATHQYAAAYKPNIAFYEAAGDQGLRELKLTMDYLRTSFPDIFTICDAKRADIGSTNEGYVEAIFDWLGFDAVTVQPYLGSEAIEPFLKRTDKVSIVLCRTSNPGAGELQDLEVGGRPLWETVAQKVSDTWNKNGNCMLVVGATYPAEMKRVREIVGDITFLVPGVGAQGGDVKEALVAGLNSRRRGMIINSSRGIIFADDPTAEAKGLQASIAPYL